MIISLRTQMGSPPTLGRAGTAPPSPPQLSLPSLLPGHFLRGPWVPGLKDWEGGLRARDTISFYPLATAPTLSLVADRGCFANKGVMEAFCQLATYLSQGRSGRRDQ